LRSAPDLDHPGAGSDTDLIEEPCGLARELLGLLPQALLLV
jgi:hypothetical protein